MDKNWPTGKLHLSELQAFHIYDTQYVFMYIIYMIRLQGESVAFYVFLLKETGLPELEEFRHTTIFVDDA